MFTQKTKKKKVVVPTVETRTINVPTASGVKAAVVPAAAAAAALAKNYADDAADWAKPHLDQSREFVEKQADQAKERVSDAPKLSTLLTSSAAAREVAAQRSHDAALVLKGEATIKPKKQSGGVLKFLGSLGLLAALGAAAAVVAQKMSKPKDDPWARPLTDPYVAPAAGRDSTVAGGTGVKVTDVKTSSTDTTSTTGADKGTETEIIAPQGQVPTAAETTATFTSDADKK